MNQSLYELFYKNKTVLVTGGAGMIGYQLVKQLVSVGAKVIVADAFLRAPKPDRPEVPDVRYEKIDVTDMYGCEYAMRQFNVRGKPVDIVFNLAADVAGVLHNQNNNQAMFQANVGIQTIVPKIAAELDIAHFLQVSSVCVYPTRAQALGAEEEFGHYEDPHPANGGYAWSKRIGEKMAELSWLQHLVVVRPTNVFGEWDYFDERSHVIPAFIERSFENSSEFRLYGDPSVVREFIHAYDAANGMMFAMMKPSGVYNISSNGENRISMIDLAHMIMDMSGLPSKEVVYDKTVSAGDPIRYVKCQPLIDAGWRNQISLSDGLNRTVEWYKEWQKKR